MFKIILIIGSGSFIGGVARFLLTKYVQSGLISSFPYGTFLVNISGCLLIGILYGLSERQVLISSEWKLFLTVGLCGGFTTFSAFSNENVMLLKDGNFLYAALYASLSVFIGLMATWLGSIITRIG